MWNVKCEMYEGWSKLNKLNKLNKRLIKEKHNKRIEYLPQTLFFFPIYLERKMNLSNIKIIKSYNCELLFKWTKFNYFLIKYLNDILFNELII